MIARYRGAAVIDRHAKLYPRRPYLFAANKRRRSIAIDDFFIVKILTITKLVFVEHGAFRGYSRIF